MSVLSRVRLTLWGIVVLAAVLSGLIAMGAFTGAGTPSTALGPGVLLDAPFSLVRHDGQATTQQDFRGKPTAWFFGFTHCPDVCPTTLFQMSEHMKALGEGADRLNVVFVSVDPERDTQKLMQEYLAAFDPRIIGLTGPQEELEKFKKGYLVYFAKQMDASGGYTMDHTSAVLLADCDGRLLTTLDIHEPVGVQLAKLQRLVQS